MSRGEDNQPGASGSGFAAAGPPTNPSQPNIHLASERLAPRPSNVCMVDIGSRSGVAPRGERYVYSKSKGCSRRGRRRRILFASIGGLIAIQAALAAVMLKRRERPPAEVKQPGALNLAAQAMRMAKLDRYAVAVGLLEEAQRRATRPLTKALLRESEAGVRMVMARRLLAKGNDVAARDQLATV